MMPYARFLSAIFVVCWALAGVEPACAAGQIVKLNGGLQAEILALGRDKNHTTITLSMKIENTGSSAAYLALSAPWAVANSNTGGRYGLQYSTVSGIEKCPNVSAAACIGATEDRFALPLQAWTEIDPGTSTVVNLSLYGGANTGPLISFSANLIYRLVSDPTKDGTLSDTQKRQQARTMSLSFAPIPVTDER